MYGVGFGDCRTNVNVVPGFGLISRRNSYFHIQDVSAEKLISATHVGVQVHKDGQGRSWTGIFIPKRHLLKCLGKESKFVS
jgi:hypothetical protein